jgi:hypothetical protein
MMVLGIAVLLIVAAAPAGAKKPEPTDDLVDVTMTLAGPEGLTTDCEDGDGVAGSLLMERTRSGLSFVDDVAPILGLYMDEVAWMRYFPESSGIGFAECHGGTVAGSPGTWDGALWIDIDRSGAVTDVLWHFDYWIEESVVVLPNGKERTRVTVREHFTLSGHDLAWDAATSTVSGTFTVKHFLNGEDAPLYIEYEPFLPSRDLAFTLTYTPHT